MNEAEMKVAQQRADGSRIAYEWMRKNIRRFEPCEANSKLIGDWLQKNSLEFTEENLDRAVEAIGDQLARAAGELVAPPRAKPTLDDIAPVPGWFPKLEVPSDIARIHHEKLKELRRGPHGEALKRRINALQQGYRNPVATPAQSAAVSTPLDDGLPPAPAGLTWPTTVQEVNRMSREDFRHLYHSKAYGEAFRTRVDEIFRRAKEGR